MSTYYRYSNITTKGNLGLVAPNLDVVSQVDGQKYNFPAGQPIVYDPTTNKTLNVAGIATAKKLRFGVGHNPLGGKLATEIRHIGAADIDLCKTMLKVNVQAPQCPTPYVFDVEFDCLKTGRDYYFALSIDDWLSRSYFKEGAVGDLTYNLRTDTTGCNNCSEDENCGLIACQLAAKITGDYIKHFPNTSKLGLNTDRPGHGVWAVRKYTTTRRFTLAASEVEDTCGGGCAVKGIKGFTATGMTALTLVNSVDPSEETQTLLEQMQTVVDQVNAWMNGKGSVFLKPTDCCTFQLEANTCLANLTLVYHDDATNTGTDSAAFTAFTPDEMCLGCGDPESITNVCGVRIFVETLELPCNCQYPDGNQPSYFGRTAKATFWGDGWNNTSYRTVVVQNQTVPLGTGYQVQQSELRQSMDGEGFQYAIGLPYNEGRVMTPNKNSPEAQAAVAQCDKPYCIWSVVTTDYLAGAPFARHVNNAQTLNYINVPREDLDTIEAIQDVLEALDARGFCNEIEHICVELES